MRDQSTNVLMDHIFGKGTGAANTKKVDDLVQKICTFKGIGAEEINKMIDSCSPEMQRYLESEEFFNEAMATFKKIDTKGSGNIEPDELEAALDLVMPADIKQKLGVTKEGVKTVVLMFDGNQDGLMQQDEFAGFLM